MPIRRLSGPGSWRFPRLLLSVGLTVRGVGFRLVEVAGVFIIRRLWPGVGLIRGPHGRVIVITGVFFGWRRRGLEPLIARLFVSRFSRGCVCFRLIGRDDWLRLRLRELIVIVGV